jgi:hypothetical protein
MKKDISMTKYREPKIIIQAALSEATFAKQCE